MIGLWAVSPCTLPCHLLSHDASFRTLKLELRIPSHVSVFLIRLATSYVAHLLSDLLLSPSESATPFCLCVAIACHGSADGRSVDVRSLGCKRESALAS